MIGSIVMLIYIINQFTFHILDELVQPNNW